MNLVQHITQYNQRNTCLTKKSMSGYPPHYGMGNNPYGNYQPPPPPLLYGYGGVNVPTPSYGGYAPSPAFNQPGQQYSGQYSINVHQQPSLHPPTNRSSYMGDLYPSLSETPQAPPAVQYYGVYECVN